MEALLAVAQEEVALEGTTGVQPLAMLVSLATSHPLQSAVPSVAGCCCCCCCWCHHCCPSCRSVHSGGDTPAGTQPGHCRRHHNHHHLLLPACAAAAGCALEKLWVLVEARLPLGGVTSLPPPLRQALWRQLRSDPHLTFLTQEQARCVRRGKACVLDGRVNRAHQHAPHKLAQVLDRS